MFPAALSVIAKRRGNPKVHQQTNGHIKHDLVITLEYYAAIKRNEDLTYYKVDKPQNIFNKEERSQSQKENTE